MSSEQTICVATFDRQARTPIQCGARQNMCLVIAIAHGLVACKCTRLSTVLTALVKKVDRIRPSIDDGMFIDHADIAMCMEDMHTDAGGFVVYEFKSAYSRTKCYAARVHTEVWDATKPIIRILWEPIARATPESTCDGHYLPVTDVVRDDLDVLLEMHIHDRMNARRVARNDALLRSKLRDVSIDADYAYALSVLDSELSCDSSQVSDEFPSSDVSGFLADDSSDVADITDDSRDSSDDYEYALRMLAEHPVPEDTSDDLHYALRVLSEDPVSEDVSDDFEFALQLQVKDSCTRPIVHASDLDFALALSLASC